MGVKITNTLIISIAVAVSLLFVCKYSRDNTMFHGDALGYYSYLPSTFIYHNLKHQEELPEDTTIFFMVRQSVANMKTSGLKSPKGYIVNQYTYAVAFMELPFFMAAHGYEKLMGYKANGYSSNYNIAIKISSAFYALLGLIFTFLVLRKNYNTFISLLTTSLVLLGTNLFWFSVHQAGMCHPILFFLYALLMYLTILVHEQPSRWKFAGIGFLVGLIVIMRPTDIVCMFIPLCYRVYNRETVKNKIAFIKDNSKGVMLAIIAGIIPLIPQLIYWKSLTGHWLFYSYGDQSFDWKHPKIIEGLFYFSNGWLPYAPAMLFAIAGILLYKRYQKWVLSIWVISPIYVYIIYSWYCYNYINGLGSRPMIHLYPLYALALAAFVQYIFSKRVVFRALFLIVAVLLVAVNYSFSELRYKVLLNTDEANGPYSLHMLFRDRIDYNDMVLSDIGTVQPDTATLVRIATLATDNFDDSTSDHYVPNSAINPLSRYCFKMSDNEYTPHIFRIPYNKKLFNDATWFKCSGRFMVNVWVAYRRHIMCVSVSREGKSIVWTGINIDNKIGLLNNECGHVNKDLKLDHFDYQRWGTVQFFTKIPSGLREGDIIECLIWNPFKQEMMVDDLKLEIYK
jgi:hypothetical protein